MNRARIYNQKSHASGRIWSEKGVIISSHIPLSTNGEVCRRPGEVGRIILAGASAFASYGLKSTVRVEQFAVVVVSDALVSMTVITVPDAAVTLQLYVEPCVQVPAGFVELTDWGFLRVPLITVVH